MDNQNIIHADLTELAAELLRNGSTVRFHAPGTSMVPFIRDGDLLDVQPIGREQIQRGDILLCTLSNGQLVAHRVVKINYQNCQETILIQGDSRLNPDGFIPIQNVLGRVVAIERGMRRMEMNARSIRFMATLWVSLAPFSKRFYHGLSWLKIMTIKLFSGHT